MRDRRGVIIYVGKAKNLRNRVRSYFRPGAKHTPKVRSMVNTVADLEFMTVRNDAEALLTEANLIKKYKPHFNILMRDDKRYLALRADPEEPFPAFRTCRIVRDDGAVYVGPFPSAPVVRAARGVQVISRAESSRKSCFIVLMLCRKLVTTAHPGSRVGVAGHAPVAARTQ